MEIRNSLSYKILFDLKFNILFAYFISKKKIQAFSFHQNYKDMKKFIVFYFIIWLPAPQHWDFCWSFVSIEALWMIIYEVGRIR